VIQGCRLLVWGAGGHGRVVASIARELGAVVVGFVDRDTARAGQTLGGNLAVCPEHELIAALQRRAVLPHNADFVALGVGDNAARLSCLDVLGPRCAPAIAHPRATVDVAASLSTGSVAMAGAIVGCGSTIGEGAIINTGALIDHDCRIGRGAHVSPGAVLTGGVALGDRVWVGAGATLIPGVCVGSDAIVGAGAVVLRDVESGATVVGNPARPIRR
jgi:sugar O-acyltransferase (sialic acid O-acetyltransferase NeuD family)